MCVRFLPYNVPPVLPSSRNMHGRALTDDALLLFSAFSKDVLSRRKRKTIVFKVLNSYLHSWSIPSFASHLYCRIIIIDAPSVQTSVP